MPEEEIEVPPRTADWWELEEVVCTSFVNLKRGKTAYRLVGQDGPCVVLLHSIFGFSYVWQDLVRQLQETQIHCRILLLDFYGRGHSPWPSAIKECTVSLLEQQLHDLVTFLRIKSKLLLVGYDIGASVAALFGSKHSEQVAGIIQAGPRGLLRPLDEVESAVREAFLGRHLFTIRGKQMLEDAHRNEFFGNKPGAPQWDLLDLHARMISWQLDNTPGYLDALASTVSHYPFHSDHAYKLIYGTAILDFSLIIIHGEEDSLYRKQDLEREVSELPFQPDRISVIRLAECGHNVVLEQPEDIAAIVYDNLVVLSPQMQEPGEVTTSDDAIIYVDADEEDHSQIFESIARAAQPPHDPHDVELALSLSHNIQAKGTLVLRLHAIRQNQHHLQHAKEALKLATSHPEEERDLFQVEVAIHQGVRAFQAASMSGASCFCEHCGGWLRELEAAESMLSQVARRRAEVDVMSFIASEKERMLDAQRREFVANENGFSWIASPAPSLGPSRESDAASYTSIPEVQGAPRQPPRGAGRGKDKASLESGESVQQRRTEQRSAATMETVATGVTGSAQERRQERRSQVSWESEERLHRRSAESADSLILPPLPAVHVHYDCTKPVPVEETVDERTRAGQLFDRRHDRDHDVDARRQAMQAGPRGGSFQSPKRDERRRLQAVPFNRSDPNLNLDLNRDHRHGPPRPRYDERPPPGRDRHDRRYHDDDRRYHDRDDRSGERDRHWDGRSRSAEGQGAGSRETMSRDTQSHDTRSMETKSRSRETNSYESMSVDTGYYRARA